MATHFGKSSRTRSGLVALAVCAAMLFLLISPVCFAQARWQADGVPVCTDPGTQNKQQLTTDGAGGAIVVWGDDRNAATGWDLYAQRVLAAGTVDPAWPADGVALCNAAGSQDDPRITSDGAGGAIIVWTDERSGAGDWDIYAQRIDGDGAIHTGWAAAGQPVCVVAGTAQWDPQIASDGVGGAIITWEDNPAAGDWDIYAQRIDGDGGIHTGWAAAGQPVCVSAGNSQEEDRIISDNDGGAIVTWKDDRDAATTGWNIYAQRIDGDGGILTGWAATGVEVCDATGNQRSAELTTDGVQGAIITWQDQRDGNWDIYVQKLDGAGAVQWTANGVALCTNAFNQVLPKIVFDEYYGAIVTWQGKPTTSEDVFAQRVNWDGVPQWAENGVVVCDAADDQRDPVITSDNQGGSVIAWRDRRTGNYDIYTQRESDYGYNWYLAEGSTGTNEFGSFETWILVQNPGDEAADVQLFYQTPEEEVEGQHVTLAAHTRETMNVSDIVPNQFSVSTRVVSDQPVVAERAMYWSTLAGVNRQAAHDSIGVTGPSYDWYLAEGSTGTNENGTFETWILVQNPGDEAADVQLFYQTPDEEIAGQHVTLEPHTRETMNVSDIVPNQFSVSTRVVSDQPVIAERAMYWSTLAGVNRQAAHDSRGVTSPATTWYLAEGSTGTNDNGSFESWILVQNPGDEAADVQLFYQTPDEEVDGQHVTLAPHTRETLNVSEVVPDQFSVSTRVDSNQPVIAERAMYWSTLAGVNRQAATDSIGVPDPATVWYLAEGSTGTNDNGSFESWILVQNPGEEAADVQLFYQTPDEEIEGQHITLAPHTRETLNVSEVVPNQFSVSTRVVSDQPVIAERAMYWSTLAGVNRQAAHDSIGFTMY